MLDNIPARSVKKCECSLHKGKNFYAFQTLVIDTKNLTKSIIYGKVSYQCDASGEKWQDEDLAYRTFLSKSEAQEREIMDQAAREIDKTLL